VGSLRSRRQRLEFLRELVVESVAMAGVVQYRTVSRNHQG
jgi:hypothetical protein